MHLDSRTSETQNVLDSRHLKLLPCSLWIYLLRGEAGCRFVKILVRPCDKAWVLGNASLPPTASINVPVLRGHHFQNKSSGSREDFQGPQLKLNPSPTIQLSCPQVLDPQKLCHIVNTCRCLKMLKLGFIYYLPVLQ